MTKNSIDVKKMSVSELKDYAASLRRRIYDITKKNGGHLASNLGSVELTLALHYVLNMPTDKVVWDVGHQTYAHKLITGREDIMENLRKDGGASGFPSQLESDYDPFITGHSGTSLSLALGLARARDLTGESSAIAAVVGDGAFTSGEIYEALNDLGDRPTKLIIILNDNKMSISRNVGAMSKYFNKLRVNKKFVDFKSNLKKDMGDLPFVGQTLVKGITVVKNKVKEGFVGNKFFERFGLKYYGPYDGHNLSEIIDALSTAKAATGPVLVHVLTQKGKGVPEAELHPDAYHGISPENEIKQLSMSLAAGKALCELAKTENIAVVTAAMTDGLCLNEFTSRYKERFFDVAIAEQHATSFCAGLAKAGIKPFFAVYSTFLQRGFDQVLHDVCINKLPVTFLIDRAGAVGADGVTHQGIFDLSYLSLIPDMAIASPKDGNELRELIRFSLHYGGPMAIRYAKSYAFDFALSAKVEFGKWEILKTSPHPVTVLAVGKTNEVAVMTKNATVINARFVKPLDTKLLDGLEGTVITLEDNILHGGFGEAVRNYLYGKNKVIAIGHADEFCDVRNIPKVFERSGLTVENVQKIIDSELLSLENTEKL